MSILLSQDKKYPSSYLGLACSSLSHEWRGLLLSFFTWFCMFKHVVYIFILLRLPTIAAKYLILIKSNLSFLSVKDHDFSLYLKSHCQTQDHLDILLCYFLGLCILHFYIYVYDPFKYFVIIFELYFSG